MRRAPSPVLYEMTAHLLLAETPFSRNRNKDAFDDPRFRAALSLYRRLRSLVRDLERARATGAELVVVEETRAGTPAVKLQFQFVDASRGRRTAWLEKPAYDVLLRHPTAHKAITALRPAA